MNSVSYAMKFNKGRSRTLLSLKCEAVKAAAHCKTSDSDVSQPFAFVLPGSSSSISGEDAGACPSKAQRKSMGQVAG